MWEIIRINDFLERKNQKNQNQDLTKLVSDWLKETPKKVKELLQTPQEEIMFLDDIEIFKKLIFEYIVSTLDNKQIVFYPNIIQASEYLSELMYKLCFLMDDDLKEALENPYYIYWLNKWDPKKAWDVSAYNYIFFRESSRKNRLSKQEYLIFAVNWYYQYAWKDFANGIQTILPISWKILTDSSFFSR